MAFRFKRKESITDGVRRLGCGQIEQALKCLKAWRRPESVHEVRKDIKKLRAMLQLIEDSIPRKAYLRQKRLLRQAAAYLAPARDAYIQLRTLENLQARLRDHRQHHGLHSLRKTLRKEARAASRRFARRRTHRSVERLLRRLNREIGRQKVSRDGWKTLGPGIATVYRRGYDAYRAGLSHPTAEKLHEWRKRAKDAWYITEYLRRMKPKQMKAAARELKTLTQLLGEDHDLTVLQNAAAHHFEDEQLAPARAALRGLILALQQKLRTKAFVIGRRCYAERPSAFGKRLHGYWVKWQTEGQTTFHRTKKLRAA